jgi:hypothetical protein
MLKLTSYDPHSLCPTTMDADIYVTPSSIVALERHNGWTTVRLAAWTYMVVNAVEEILAMPEMLNILHPIMTIDPVTGRARTA